MNANGTAGGIDGFDDFAQAAGAALRQSAPDNGLVVGGGNQPWSEIRAVMGTERITAAYVLEFAGGSVAEVGSLLRLGDPMGVHIVLAPA